MIACLCARAATGASCGSDVTTMNVAGKAGESFDIMFDKTQLTVSCDVVE